MRHNNDNITQLVIGAYMPNYWHKITLWFTVSGTPVQAGNTNYYSISGTLSAKMEDKVRVSLTKFSTLPTRQSTDQRFFSFPYDIERDNDR
jgi:hypothetical protein